jgi:hypothetical protein
MKGLVWALYLMVQDPGASATSWAYTGVTYLSTTRASKPAQQADPGGTK